VARKASAPLPKSRSARTNDVPSREERREERRDRAGVPGRAEQAGSIPGMAEAVPTDGKPRKNQAGLAMRELEHFRDLLLAKRRELVGDMSSMEREALRNSGGSNLSTLPIHMADMGTDNYEQEFTLGLVEKDRNLLREINNALAKIQNGTYGICEGTGQPISKPRLEAQPWARYSIEYARNKERGMLR
jgi:RNA polymerase-binding protein DksA